MSPNVGEKYREASIMRAVSHIAALPLRALAAPVLVAGSLLAATPAVAETPAAPSGPLCSASVLTALTAWDAGLATAAKFGDKAVAIAREKGREYLLPLLGVDPQSTNPSTAPGGDDRIGAIERFLEDTRQDPARRQDLCIAITQAVEDAKSQAGAGLDSLRRALDGLRLPDQAPGQVPGQPLEPRPAPGTAPANQDGMIRI